MEEGQIRPTYSTGGPFVPRAAASRPKARLKPATSVRIGQVPFMGASSSGVGKGQDDFRKMLNG